MPSKPDTPCADCGKLLWSSTTSLPAGERRCRDCRGGLRRPAACAYCGEMFTSRKRKRGWARCCSKSCARKLERPRVTAACEACGMEFTRKASEMGRFCSVKCSGKVHRDRRRNWPHCSIYVGRCAHCQSVFTAQRKHRCCTDDCAQELSRQRGRQQRKAAGRSCSDCSTPIEPGKWQRRCDDCKAAAYRASRRAHKAWRRARERGVGGERFDPAEVFHRDNWRCGLCGKAIDPALNYPHRRSASLDHIVPLSWGGEHHPDNCQPAHLGCNMAKGARVDHVQPLLLIA